MNSIRECVSRVTVDLQTLVWTRGKEFPTARLESRMRCIRCGSRRVVVHIEAPRTAGAAAGTVALTLLGSAAGGSRADQLSPVAPACAARANPIKSGQWRQNSPSRWIVLEAGALFRDHAGHTDPLHTHHCALVRIFSGTVSLPPPAPAKLGARPVGYARRGAAATTPGHLCIDSCPGSKGWP
jgi:hypothetical protein